MGFYIGHDEEVSINAPFVSTEDSQPVYENNAEGPNSKNDRSQSLEARGSLIKPESDSPCQKADKKRGKTRGKGRKLRYLDGSRWVPAVYHHDIRSFLIQQASQNGEYTYPRERGLGRDDVTSFLESQKNWGPDRDKNWADVLYVFQKDKAHKDPSYELKSWKFRGKIVLSAYDDRPIRLFRDLPDTLSSALHGRDMEAMKRTDPRIQQRDFMVRMPIRHTTPAGTRRPLQSASSIGMRMTRFRQQQGMLSWIGRDGSKTIRNALWERLPPENKRANSVRGLAPPSIAEQEEIKMGNAGKFLNRAGRRALTSEERARRKEIMERRLKQRRERELRAAEARVKSEQYARQGIPLHDGTAGWRPTGNLGVDGLAEFDVEQIGYNTRPDRPDNRTGQPCEVQARGHEMLERRDRKLQDVQNLRDGISGESPRGGRPAGIVDIGTLTKPTAAQRQDQTGLHRPNKRKFTAEQSQDQAGLHIPNKRVMLSPKTNKILPRPGKEREERGQGYNQVGDRSEGEKNNTDYNDNNLFGRSDLPSPPRDFNIEAFLNDFHANHLKSSTNPSPLPGYDAEQLLEGLDAANLVNTGDYPSSQKKSNEQSPDIGWNFDYSLSESQAESVDQRRSLPNKHNYPSPPDYSIGFKGPLDEESEGPYYLQTPRRF